MFKDINVKLVALFNSLLILLVPLFFFSLGFKTIDMNYALIYSTNDIQLFVS